MTPTSMVGWGATALPSTMCPLPKAYTGEQALQAYLNAKKNMPGLTPAAWRKQAAIDLGMDYDSYLALWKIHKGSASVAKSLNIPLAPVSSPTVPAAASNSVTMNIAAKAVPKYSYDAAVTKIHKLEDDFLDGKLSTSAYHGKLDEVMNNLKVSSASLKGKLDETVSKMKGGNTGDDFGELIEDTTWKPNAAMIPDQVDEIENAYIKGTIGEDHAVGLLKGLKANTSFMGTKSKIDDLIEQIKPAHQQVAVGGETLQTAFGPLTHDLAQNVYKKMKKDFPGGTPAQWRHSAAEYLGVDYNDYLKAWKKTTTSAQKKITTPFSKLPDSTDTYASPSTAGKYANVDISVDQLKDELARLYGPSANKQYISLTYDDVTGAYQVQFPSSILPTTASKQAVVKGLEKLGLKVEQHGSWYHIKTLKAAKTAKSNVSQIKSTGTYTLPDGTIVWDMTKAQEWSDVWVKTLSSTQRSAMKSYTGSGYIKMNGALRRSKGKEVSPSSRALSSAMRPMDHEFTVFRGTDIDISQFQVGKLWTEDGFMSTAINPGSAWSGIKFEIVVPKGTKGAYAGTNSTVSSENEFIIDMGTKFRVIEVDTQRRKVKMVAIPHK
jgi:hypothetical protein